ncbi:hypothetical protein FQN49_004485 [Arthroderma sp. PD_2]|nr:hypothetical protein FQN49_004485 [Arthroderma sp. PD_2]
MYYSDNYEYYECETCTRQFATWRSCCQHMNATVHWAPTYECESCSKDFYSQNAANQHMDAVGHWASGYECETCNNKYRSRDDAIQHMEDYWHYNLYCDPCDRTFQNQNNLKMHLTSKVHRGGSVRCPFCGGGFTTASGLVHHLERAACPRAPNMNRETILRKIREIDPHSRVANRQIDWRNEEDRMWYSATSHAFNGRCWQCYLCHSGFNTINGLNRHLNSSAHKQKVYRCPNSRAECAKEFVTLAALFNHLESESCAAMRFDAVQRGVNDMIMGRRLIGT